MSHLTPDQIHTLKNKLLSRRQKLLTEMAGLKKDDPFADPDHTMDNAAVDTDVREQVDHMTIESELKNLQEGVDLVEEALRKMEKGTYGHCMECDEEIPMDRLDLVPEASYCIKHSNIG